MGPVYLLPRRPTQLCVTSLLCPQLQGVISVQKLGLKTVGARKGTVAGLRAAPQRLPPFAAHLLSPSHARRRPL